MTVTAYGLNVYCFSVKRVGLLTTRISLFVCVSKNVVVKRNGIFIFFYLFIFYKYEGY